jgi:hypothetical protein
MIQCGFRVSHAFAWMDSASSSSERRDTPRRWPRRNSAPAPGARGIRTLCTHGGPIDICVQHCAWLSQRQTSLNAATARPPSQVNLGIGAYRDEQVNAPLLPPPPHLPPPHKLDVRSARPSPPRRAAPALTARGAARRAGRSCCGACAKPSGRSPATTRSTRSISPCRASRTSSRSPPRHPPPARLPRRAAWAGGLRASVQSCTANSKLVLSQSRQLDCDKTYLLNGMGPASRPARTMLLNTHRATRRSSSGRTLPRSGRSASRSARCLLFKNDFLHPRSVSNFLDGGAMLLCLPPPVSPLSATLHAMPALGLFLHGERERERREREREEKEKRKRQRESVCARAPLTPRATRQSLSGTGALRIAGEFIASYAPGEDTSPSPTAAGRFCFLLTWGRANASLSRMHLLLHATRTQRAHTSPSPLLTR